MRSGDDNHDRRLHVGRWVSQQFKAPDDLRHRHRREFLKLQFDHRSRFRQVCFRKLDHPQEDMLSRNPGDVQLRLKKRLPIFRDQLLRQRLAAHTRFLPLQRHFAPAAGGEAAGTSACLVES